MKPWKTLITTLCGTLILAFPLDGHSVTTLSIQFEDTLRVIRLDMPRREVIETLGAPDIIKSEGMCLQYESLGLSMFINRNDQVEQIYLSRNFRGSVSGKQPTGSIQLADIEREFGAHAVVDRLNYQPSPLVQNRATVETENKSDPTGKEKGEFPLQYPGNRKLYVFYSGGKVMKYKYVLDEEGIAFWLDDNKQLYATVLYTSRVKDMAAHLPAAAPEPFPTKEPAPEKAPVTIKEAPKIIRLPIVHFDFDKYDIKKIYIPDLDQHVAHLNDSPAATVVVEGHTDSRGSVRYNQGLSERRAHAVRRYLIERGIASERIRVVGYSELRPVADNRTAEGRALNRRAEFEVTVEK